MVTSRLPGNGAPDQPLVEIANLSRRFGGTQALEDISFTLGRGQVLGIIGRSGAGKSTLLRCLNGLERPDSGKIIISGTDIADKTEAELRAVRQRIGMIFQHFNLLSSRTALENVALPLKLNGIPRAARFARARELLELVGLADKASAYPARLSGGQKQRVGIARALASEPSLLLCDEATSALDPETTQSILELLRGINRKLGLTIILITHEMNVARQIADRVLVLSHGRIVEEGPATEILSAPQAEETKLMLRAAGFLNPEDSAFTQGGIHARLAG